VGEERRQYKKIKGNQTNNRKVDGNKCRIKSRIINRQSGRVILVYIN
jgi:hypothetical protein